MAKNDIYAAIAVLSSNLPANFPSSIKGVSINKDRPSAGEVRRFGRKAFVLPIILAMVLLPIAAFFLWYAIEFGFRSSEEYRNFVIFPCLIVVVAAVLITVIVAVVRTRFAARVNRVVGSGQRVRAKVIELSHVTKYAATTRSSGGPIMLAVLYEYQNLDGKIVRVRVRFRLAEEHRFYEGKEIELIVDQRDKLNIMLI
ncbi:MAG: ABC transporter permease [Firmicutes bacterium]|nr:ABC transporter permease [Bacillota bacterium]